MIQLKNIKAKIYSHDQLIGTADLRSGDESMGALSGEFIGTEFYYQSIQKSVWKFWSTPRPNYQEWHSLRINVQLENGIFLFPEGGYTIDDIMELPNEPKRIDISGVDGDIIQGSLLKNTSQSFVNAPWSDLSIRQKIAFEDELQKELGIRQNWFLNIFRPSNKHILADAEFSALCKDQRNDDVLFEIRKPKFPKKYALVHLSWIGQKENSNYPSVKLYDNFNDFKLSKMELDKKE